MIAMPPRVTRNFTNVSDHEASLLVLIQGERDRFQDVDLTPALAAKIVSSFGADVKRKLELKGLAFTAGLDVPLPADQVTQRRGQAA
jgi:hypothetical protein